MKCLLYRRFYEVSRHLCCPGFLKPLYCHSRRLLSHIANNEHYVRMRALVCNRVRRRRCLCETCMRCMLCRETPPIEECRCTVVKGERSYNVAAIVSLMARKFLTNTVSRESYEFWQNKITICALPCFHFFTKTILYSWEEQFCVYLTCNFH